MALKIPNGGSEPIYSAGLLDAGGTLLTGLANVLLRIRRDSDGFYYDFFQPTIAFLRSIFLFVIEYAFRSVSDDFINIKIVLQ